MTTKTGRRDQSLRWIFLEGRQGTYNVQSSPGLFIFRAMLS